MRFVVGKESGQSVVEFALVFPVILLLFLGAVQLVLLGANRVIAENAAYDAARSLSVAYGELGHRAAVGQAEAILEDRTAMALAGPGLLKRPFRIKSLAVNGSVGSLTVEGRVELLPIFKQAVAAFGVVDGVPLRTTAGFVVEPYTGE